MKLNYFTEKEFNRCKPSCSLDQMNEAFMHRLDYAREILNMPISINSAYRTVEYEKTKGRSGTSSHCKGLAVDIRCTASGYRLVLVLALMKAGFRRIGVGDTFVHVDADPEKPNSFWLY